MRPVFWGSFCYFSSVEKEGPLEGKFSKSILCICSEFVLEREWALPLIIKGAEKDFPLVHKISLSALYNAKQKNPAQTLLNSSFGLRHRNCVC